MPSTLIGRGDDPSTFVVRARPGDADTWFERVETLRAEVAKVASKEDIERLEADERFRWAKPAFAQARKLWKDGDLRAWVTIIIAILSLVVSVAKKSGNTTTLNVQIDNSLHNESMFKVTPGSDDDASPPDIRVRSILPERSGSAAPRPRTPAKPKRHFKPRRK
jgi:hypothetical protein